MLIYINLSKVFSEYQKEFQNCLKKWHSIFSFLQMAKLKFEMIRPILAQSFLLRESYSITKIERSPTHALEKFPWNHKLDIFFFLKEWDRSVLWLCLMKKGVTCNAIIKCFKFLCTFWAVTWLYRCLRAILSKKVG